MKLRPIVKIAILNLYASKQRSLLALIGISIGISAVISMINIGKMAENETMKNFAGMNVDVINVNIYSSNGNNLTRKEINSLPNLLNSIQISTPVVNADGQLYFKGKQLELTMLGIEESFNILNNFKTTHGRLISNLDLYRDYVVISPGVVDEINKATKKNYLPADLIGQTLNTNKKIFKIIGVLSQSYPIIGFFSNNMVYMPFSTALRTVRYSSINKILMKKLSSADTTKVTEEINNYFSKRLPGTNVNIMNAEQIIQQIKQQMFIYTVLLSSIGIISLILGGVGVMNVMLSAISERKKEIGIRRAFGAKQMDIQNQFLVESIVLCLIGGIIGMITSVVIIYIIASLAKWDFMFSLSALFIGFGSASAVGIFFGIFPSRQASKLDPILVLRD